MTSPQYMCTHSKTVMAVTPNGLVGEDGRCVPYLSQASADNPIPNFLATQAILAGAQLSLEMYDTEKAAGIYRNFLNWLFAAFREDEAAVRRGMAARLRLAKGGRVLVTGCGLGDDIPAILEAVGPTGQVYAQDLSPAMVLRAQTDLRQRDRRAYDQVFFSVGNAVALPFADGFFDAAYHFGGINLFDDIKGAIAEMNRAVRPGGRVMFGDEGVAPWLKEKEYGKIAICNNALWSANVPLPLLPDTCLEVNVSWILGNCFYIVDFMVSDTGPVMDIDLPHKGRRGGTPRTRYFGQLEGVTEETKEKVLAAAAAAGTSVHDWLEMAIAKAL